MTGRGWNERGGNAYLAHLALARWARLISVVYGNASSAMTRHSCRQAATTDRA